MGRVPGKIIPAQKSCIKRDSLTLRSDNTSGWTQAVITQSRKLNGDKTGGKA